MGIKRHQTCITCHKKQLKEVFIDKNSIHYKECRNCRETRAVNNKKG